MAEQTTNQAEAKRPTFLTVLCILTFIGSSLGIIFSILGIVGVGAMDNLASNFAGASVESAGTGKLIGTAVFNALSLTGAILMWKLKKIGFFAYVLAQALIVIFGWSIMTLVFAVIFVVLYALNYKALQ